MKLNILSLAIGSALMISLCGQHAMASGHMADSTQKAENLSSTWQAWVDSRAPGSDLIATDFTRSSLPVVTNFAYAGYRQSEQPLPTLNSTFNCSSGATIDPATGYTIFDVTKYGAIPNDGKSDKAAVRDAITVAEKAIQKGSVKGAVLLFPKGRYRMNESSDMALIDPDSKESLASQSITVTESRVILRGCGRETELYMDQPHLPMEMCIRDRQYSQDFIVNKPLKTIAQTTSALLLSMPLLLVTACSTSSIPATDLAPSSPAASTAAMDMPVPGINKGELLYQSKMDSSESVKDWVMEGPGKIAFEDGWMRMWSPNEEWQHVFWAPKAFPESFVAQWEMQNLHTEAGLTIVFFAATGPNGEDVMDASLPERDGTFKFYNNDVLSNYHISYYAHNPEAARLGVTRLRKNTGKHLVSEGPTGIKHDSTAIHKITLVKNKDHIVFYVDDREIINWVDDGTVNGKVYGAGRIALRQMEWSVFRYRNFKVWSVDENNEGVNKP